MILRPPRLNLTDTIFPTKTLVRSCARSGTRKHHALAQIDRDRLASIGEGEIENSLGPLHLGRIEACGERIEQVKRGNRREHFAGRRIQRGTFGRIAQFLCSREIDVAPGAAFGLKARSEEHTSELQSLMRTSYAVFCLKKH